METIRIWDQGIYKNGVAGDEAASYQSSLAPAVGDYFVINGREWIITKRIFKIIDRKLLIDILAHPSNERINADR